MKTKGLRKLKVIMYQRLQEDLTFELDTEFEVDLLIRDVCGANRVCRKGTVKDN